MFNRHHHVADSPAQNRPPPSQGHLHTIDVVDDRSRLCLLIRPSTMSPSTSCNWSIVQWVLWWDKDDLWASIISWYDFGTTPSSATTTTSTSTSATSTLRGYHAHVVLADFYSSQSISSPTRCWGGGNYGRASALELQEGLPTGQEALRALPLSWQSYT
jgi:hypothetical protein